MVSQSPAQNNSSLTHDQSDMTGHGTRLLPQVLDELASTDPNHVLGMAAKIDISEGFNSLTALQLSQAVNYTAHWLESHIGASHTIAYIGIHDFRYWVMELAAIKIGHPLLLPGPRNALPNTSTLLEATDCSVVFYSGNCKEHAIQLKGLVEGLQVVEVPDLEEMINTPSKPYLYNKTWEEAKDDVVVVIHTSGSTGAPKPIYYTNKTMAFLDSAYLNPSVPGRMSPTCYTMITKKKPFLSSTPFFHSSGICFGAYSIFCPATSVIGPPNAPPTGKLVVEIARKIELDGMIMVPSLCDAVFTEYRDYIRPFLGSVKHICWLGGPLADSTGDWIVNNTNIHLWQIFGSTEVGAHFMMEPPKSHWNYMEFHPITGPKLEQISPDSDLYEVVTQKLPDPNLAWTRIVFDLFPGIEEWRSKDLLSKCTDPGFENLWKYEGRLDDIIVLSNALKVNPLHIEASLQTHPALKGAMVFGRDHTKCGILLEPKDPKVTGDALIEEVWPVLERANALVPGHARIQRDFVVVATPEKPFQRASKGTIVRSLTTKDYESEIEGAYRAAA
ncbi:hypothetical protein V500_00445 [Pseudogymnoascus sp. VKM F-4518 (FW-2643)]|nr:hypothetical protein V500_00445 [Pseudogymnoascus sp. VKM F-4518 (FW-2643)]